MRVHWKAEKVTEIPNHGLERLPAPVLPPQRGCKTMCHNQGKGCGFSVMVT